MDKFNVIIPTADLDELNMDMASWCSLPYNMRMRSDEECIRAYGMTNAELYNRIKEKILLANIVANKNRDNLIISNEAIEASSDENSWANPALIDKSLELQKSPYIVLVDPILDTVEAATDRYIKYMLLNSKNRLISNNYSLMIYGYNVPNMYAIVLDTISQQKHESELDSDNIKTDTSNSVMEYFTDYANQMIISENSTNIIKMKLDALSPDLTTEDTDMYNNIITEADQFELFDAYNLPETPWFCYNEMSNFDLPRSGYIKAVKEAMDAYEKDSSEANCNAVLSLGWNPSVSVNENSIKYAKLRQLDFLNNNAPRVINISEINTTCVDNPTVLPQLFFNLYIVLNRSMISESTIYNKFGIAFSSRMDQIYTVNIEDNCCLGFTLEQLSNYNDIDIILIKVDKQVYTALATFIASHKDINKSDIKIKSLYTVLANTKNKYDPASARLYYLKILDIIKELISYNNDMEDYAVSYGKNVYLYKIYSGLSADYKEDNILKILSILNCKDYREKFIISNCQNYNVTGNEDSAKEIYKEMLSIYTPTKVIMSISD